MIKNILNILLVFALISCGKTAKSVKEEIKEPETLAVKNAQQEILNIAEIGEELIENKVEIVKEAPTNHKIWNDLLAKNVTSNGSVSYKGFIDNKVKLQEYLDILAQKIPEDSWSKNAKLSYWINAYNAFTIKLILDNYPLKSIKDINNPWGKEFITLASKKYSLEDIEHKILRKMNEPRIHFAINCASFSCPNLLNEAFLEETMEVQLEKTAEAFINDKTKNTITANQIEISEIFNWFSSDFKSNGSVIDYLNRYSSVKINAKAKTKFKDYNWNLNE